METRFIDGDEFVDKATYIETRDKLSRSIERIAELEAFTEAPLQCHSCGSWGPFEREAPKETG